VSNADELTLRLAERKRGGAATDVADIQTLVAAYTAGDVGDDAMTKWLRAVCANGMTTDETVALTRAMARSGETIDWGGDRSTVVDKHSTGGVGDAVTLVAVPLAAACGARVAKLAGRALGHTGGTLDKIECVPGARVELTVGEFKAQVMSVGCAVAAATISLAPADRKIYELRHRTGTVASIPLIAASIMSKKIAAGAPAIVLDVKVGAGAFMRDLGAARELAQTMVDIGARTGRRVRALLTAMDAPLADAVGDALELDQALRVLEGGGSPQLREVSCAIATAMIEMAGVASTESAAVVDRALRDGSALAKLRAMLEAQGGALDRFDRDLPDGAAVAAPAGGCVSQIEAGAIGAIVADAKSGRPAAQARRVGVRVVRRVGAAVREGEPILRFVAPEPQPEILRLLNQTVKVGTLVPRDRPILLGVVGAGTVTASR
jgi:pyrimidine-nucleoside phosphorylase